MEQNMKHIAQEMRSRGFAVEELRTAAEAREFLLEHIPAGASVAAGGSVSVRDTDVLAGLKEKGCQVYDHWTVPKEEEMKTRQAGRSADVYLSSANAVTGDGRLVLIDGIGNRVGAIVDGPKEVYFVVSHSKAVDGGINAAIARIKKTACPQNARRLGRKTPCAEAGNCNAKDCKESMCCLTVVLDRVPKGRAMTVLFVEEALGY